MFATAPEVSNNDACYKSGQNWLKNTILATLIQIREADFRCRK